jgi:hypothetical protein
MDKMLPILACQAGDLRYTYIREMKFGSPA